jgi:hypothetical protein
MHIHYGKPSIYRVHGMHECMSDERLDVHTSLVLMQELSSDTRYRVQTRLKPLERTLHYC